MDDFSWDQFSGDIEFLREPHEDGYMHFWREIFLKCFNLGKLTNQGESREQTTSRI